MKLFANYSNKINLNLNTFEKMIGWTGHPVTCNPMPLLKHNDPDIDYNEMERLLALEMAKMKAKQERRTRELKQMAENSEDIKTLRHEIEAAKLNQMRAAQVAEQQFKQ